MAPDTLKLSASLRAGFYCADTVSLSFGALSVNDVVAAAVTVAFCEIVSYIYYSVYYTATASSLLDCLALSIIAFSSHCRKALVVLCDM